MDEGFRSYFLIMAFDQMVSDFKLYACKFGLCCTVWQMMLSVSAKKLSLDHLLLSPIKFSVQIVSIWGFIYL